jgi:hypothetical protein
LAAVKLNEFVNPYPTHFLLMSCYPFTDKS